jgi:hypothetical protein
MTCILKKTSKKTYNIPKKEKIINCFLKLRSERPQVGYKSQQFYGAMILFQNVSLRDTYMALNSCLLTSHDFTLLDEYKSLKMVLWLVTPYGLTGF